MASDPQTADSYSKYASNYHDDIYEGDTNTWHTLYEKPAIRAALPPLQGLDVISIGCGSGMDAKWLKDNGAKRVVGIDNAEGMIELAKSKFDDIEFHVMNMEKLDFPDDSFDLAYSSLAIHYVDDWTKALSEAKRVLKPGSQYIFSTGHPIDGSYEYSREDGKRRALIGREVDEGTKERKTIGNYLVPDEGGVKKLEAPFWDSKVAFFHRPFSKMIEQINNSGLKIEKLIEPMPQPELKEIQPTKYEQLTKIPAFMIWVLKKD